MVVREWLRTFSLEQAIQEANEDWKKRVLEGILEEV